jgi:serine/threonine-protein kinase HipA
MTNKASNSLTAASLSDVNRVSVFMNDTPVGTLAKTPDGLSAFEYDASWLSDGFPISPLSLPLRPGVFIPERHPFNGLFGVFEDSLPDGWGALLMTRMLKRHGIDAESAPPLALLALVGSSGRGGLRYEPQLAPTSETNIHNLDALAESCRKILQGKESNDLDEVFAAGGSSGGARPKVYLKQDGIDWLVKFRASMDAEGAGAMEAAYADAARDCGINMPRTRLMPSNRCEGYFAAERFDRDKDGCGIHMLTASGLLEVSHRIPALDYVNLFQATWLLTNNQEEIQELFRRMCFNVYAHNQDDHSNNFSWLCVDGEWTLSPAYDLTYSTSFGNEHATMVDGEGNPDTEDLLTVAKAAGLDQRKAKTIAGAIEERCRLLLNDARDNGWM